ncbi:hypothetical protein SDC9_157598 [bioreactor metagenome]|uniref:Uncharacterized protein n=1 Tax=bioreactor metagenome TaxID=1076179 RepID=A0A645FD53_9ZZZZ
MKTDLSCLQNSVLNEKTLGTDPELDFILYLFRLPEVFYQVRRKQVKRKPGNAVKGFKLLPSKVINSIKQAKPFASTSGFSGGLKLVRTPGFI